MAACRSSLGFLRRLLVPLRSLQSAATPLSAKDYLLGNGPSSMRGAILWSPGKPMTIEDFQMPRPKAGEILIKTKACGICHSDLHVLKKEQPYPLPCVLGHEVTGEVVEHGANTDSATMKRFPLGAHVVGSFIMPCGGCFYCVKGQEDLCELFFSMNRAKGTLYDGETRLFLKSNGRPIHMYSMGGLAEYCVIPSTALAVLPDVLPYAESAILGCAMFTAYGAMKNAADLRAGESVAIVGTGGVGTSCLQVARAFGSPLIIAVDIDDKKLENAKKFGATHVINGTKEDVEAKIKDLTGGRGVDIAIEALGKAQTFQQTVSAVRPGGRAVMIGLAPFGETAQINITNLVRNQIRVIGSYGARARQDLPALVRLVQMDSFNIKSAVTEIHPLEEAEKCYWALDKREIIGRAIVQFSS